MNLPDWLQSVAEWEDNLARATNAARDAANSGDEALMRRTAWEVQYAAEHIVWALEEFFLMSSLSDIERDLHELCEAHREYVKKVDEIKKDEAF